MSVLFCDVVDSTKLSTQIDPEDFREIIEAYVKTAESVIRSFDGTVATFLGDGVMAYYGYPQAHEDDAGRACLTGLGIIDAMPGLNVRLKKEYGVEIAVRIGIHTGQTVVGSLRGDDTDDVAIGETLNIASRIQSEAEPNTVVISRPTARLVRNHVTTELLGLRELKGILEPVEVLKVLSAGKSLTYVDDSMLSPLVGRESELSILSDAWKESTKGNGQLVLVRGEGGAGKTRLIDELRERLPKGSYSWLVGRCSSYTVDSALRPIVDMAPQLLLFTTDDDGRARANKLEAGLRSIDLASDENLALFSALFNVPLAKGRVPPLELSPQVQRGKTLATLAEAMIRMSKRRPLVLVLDDLHWVDQSTLEFVDLLSARAHEAAVLILVVGRPDFHPPWSVDAEIPLGRLSRAEVGALAIGVAGGKSLPPSVIDEIVQKAEGNPLFVEELTRTVLESGQLVEEEDKYETADIRATISIPTTLHESLMARLDRIAQAKMAVQVGAAIGRQFSYKVLRDVLQDDEAKTKADLDLLVSSGMLFQRGETPNASYNFKHALLQEAAYESLTRKTRVDVNSRIADAIIANEPDTAPEILAQHMMAAGRESEAVPLWLAAGQIALGGFALAESAHNLRNGIAAVNSLPETAETLGQKLELNVTLGVPLMLTQGFAAPEVADHYNTLLEVCDRAGAAADGSLFPALWGLWTFHEVGAHYAQAQEMGERLFELAERIDDSGVRLGAHVAYGGARLMQGDLRAAREHFEAGLRIYDMEAHAPLAMLFGQDAGAMCAAFLTWVHAHEGDRASGRARAEEANSLVEALGQPSTRAFVKSVLASHHCLRGELDEAEACARELMGLSEEQGMPHWLAQGQANLGWALSEKGMHDEAAELIEQGLATLGMIGTRAAKSYFSGALVLAELGRGNAARAIEILDELDEFMDDGGERYFEAELLRLRGEAELLAAQPDARERAAEAFGRAAEVAAAQGAGAFAATAAAALADLPQA